MVEEEFLVGEKGVLPFRQLWIVGALGLQNGAPQLQSLSGQAECQVRKAQEVEGRG